MALTSSRTAELNAAPRGAQRPRVCHVPPYRDSTGGEAIELAARVGLHLDEWQQFVLRESLGEREDGKWAAQTVGLVVGRQNGKGSILEARQLAGLFLLDEQLIIHTAHLQKTATNHFKRLRNLIRRVPEFERRVVSAPTGKGSEAIHLDSGQTIFFATRQGGGGKGLTADLIVYDEAMYLTEQDRASLAPTLAARSMEGNIQLWYVGSAVDQQDPAHDGVPFAQVRERGMADTDGVAFFEWSVPGDDPDAVPDALAADPSIQGLANPGMDIRISAEWIEHERTVELNRRSFAVERLGVGDWPDTTGEAGRVISREAWAACARTDDLRPTGPKTFAVDVSPFEAFGSIAVAGKRDDGLFHVAVVEHKAGTHWMKPMLRGLLAERGSRLVGERTGPAAAVVQDLIDDGLMSEKDVVSSREYAQMCAEFFNAVAERLLRYPVPQPDLDAALASARTTPLEGAWKWSRKNSTSADISPLIAATHALGAARRKKARSRVINPADYQ